jgi:hypothetical protein
MFILVPLLVSLHLVMRSSGGDEGEDKYDAHLAILMTGNSLDSSLVL